MLEILTLCSMMIVDPRCARSDLSTPVVISSGFTAPVPTVVAARHVWVIKTPVPHHVGAKHD